MLSGCKPQLAPLETGTSSGTSTVDFWRKEEAGDWGGSGWLGWSWEGDQLRAVELDVRDRPNDFAGDDEYVTVQSQPDVTFAARCIPQLRAGPIVSAGITNWSLQSDGALSVTLGRRKYQVYIESAQTDRADAQIMITEGGRRQILYSADGFVDEPHYEGDAALFETGFDGPNPAAERIGDDGSLCGVRVDTLEGHLIEHFAGADLFNQSLDKASWLRVIILLSLYVGPGGVGAIVAALICTKVQHWMLRRLRD